VWAKVIAKYPSEIPPAATTTSFAPSEEEMDVFKIGFWTVVSFGLFALIMYLVRMLGAQDHRAS